MISKNIVRQRIISSHSHLAGKLRAGVLTGHTQALSSYQYETVAHLPNSELQDPTSNNFPQSRDSSLMYHCFKHRGMFLVCILQVMHNIKITQKYLFLRGKKLNYDITADHVTLQIIPDTWSLDVSGHTWRHHLYYQRSTTFVHLPLMSLLYCLTRTVLRRSPPERHVCMVIWRQSLDQGQRTQMTWPTLLQLTATCGQLIRVIALRASHTNPSLLTSPALPPSPLWCHTPPHQWFHDHRLTWGPITQQQSRGACPSYHPPLHHVLQLCLAQAIHLCTTRNQAPHSDLTEISQPIPQKAQYLSENHPTSTKWGWVAQGVTGLTANVDQRRNQPFSHYISEIIQGFLTL